MERDFETILGPDRSGGPVGVASLVGVENIGHRSTAVALTPFSETGVTIELEFRNNYKPIHISTFFFIKKNIKATHIQWLLPLV